MTQDYKKDGVTTASSLEEVVAFIKESVTSLYSGAFPSPKLSSLPDGIQVLEWQRSGGPCAEAVRVPSFTVSCALSQPLGAVEGNGEEAPHLHPRCPPSSKLTMEATACFATWPKSRASSAHWSAFNLAYFRTRESNIR